MFQSVSWSAYFSYLTAIVIVYYIVIIISFFRHELVLLLKHGNKTESVGNLVSQTLDQEKLFSELRSLIGDAHPREELIAKIAKIVRSHHDFDTSKVDQFITGAFPQLDQSDRKRILHF